MGRRPTILEYLHAPNDYPTVQGRPQAMPNGPRNQRIAPAPNRPWEQRIPYGPGGIVDGAPAPLPLRAVVGGDPRGTLADYLIPEAGMAPDPNSGGPMSLLPPKHGLEPPTALPVTDTLGPAWHDALRTTQETMRQERRAADRRFTAGMQGPQMWTLPPSRRAPR